MRLCLLEARSIGSGSRHPVGEDPFTTRLLKGLILKGKGLEIGGDTGIAKFQWRSFSILINLIMNREIESRIYFENTNLLKLRSEPEVVGAISKTTVCERAYLNALDQERAKIQWGMPLKWG